MNAGRAAVGKTREIRMSSLHQAKLLFVELTCKPSTGLQHESVLRQVCSRPGLSPAQLLYISHQVLRCSGRSSAVATFTTEGEAVKLANDSEFGLAGAVISADEARCKRVAEALQVGPCI